MQVGHAGIGDGAAVDAGLHGHAGEGDVAAIAAADDAHPLGVDHAGDGEGLHAIGDVGLHLPAPLAEPRREQVPAKAVRAAELRLQHRIALGRQRLGPPVEVERVPGLRPAMRQDDQRQVLRLSAVGNGEVGHDRAAVGSLVGDHVDRGHVLRLELEVGVPDGGGLAGVQVDEDVGDAMDLAGDLDHDLAAVVRPGLQLDLFAGKGLEDRVPPGLVLGIEEDVVGLRVAPDPADHALAPGIEDVAVEAFVDRRGLGHLASAQRDQPIFVAIVSVHGHQQ